MSISDLVVVLVGFLFAAFGIGFWIAPEDTAPLLHLEATGGAGLDYRMSRRKWRPWPTRPA